MIHELRTYGVQPGRLADYMEIFGTIGRPARGDRFGKLIGYFSTELGPLNQVSHMWEFPDLGARTEARASLGKEERWVKEYLPRSQALLTWQENMILTPMDWYPLKPATGMSVYELRSYRFFPGKIPEWAKLAREGLPIREKYSSPVGFWQVEVGALNTIVHIWPYRDAQHRTEVRKAVGADPGWQAILARLYPLIQHQETKLLTPASFSPLH